MSKPADESRDLNLYKKMKRLYDDSLKLRGSKLENLRQKEFLSVADRATFLSRKSNDSPRKVQMRQKLEQSEAENRFLKRKLTEEIEYSSQLDTELDRLQDEYEQNLHGLGEIEQKYGRLIGKLVSEKGSIEKSLKLELTQLQTNYEEAKEKLTKAETKLDTSDVSYLKKKLRRKENTIQQKKEKITEKKEKLRETNKDLKEANKELKQARKQTLEAQESLSEVKEKLNESLSDLDAKKLELTQIKTEKANLQSLLYYYKTKDTKKENNIEIMKQQIEQEKLELSVKNKDLELKAKELEVIDALLNHDTIKTFANGKYEDFVRMTIMELLSMNVSVNKVNDVIMTVLKHFTGKVPEKLPSKGLRSQMLIEARHLADIQVGEAMLQNLDLTTVLGNTLHGEGTTKYHRHYQNFQVTTSDGETLSAGLLEIGSQTADSLLNTWKEKVSEIASALSGKHAGQEKIDEITLKLLASVKNTMSDHCATNGAFNALLEDLRKEVLPKVVESWDQLSSSEREKLSEMSNFFCKVHPLISFAEAANKALLRFENAILDGKSKHALPISGESGSVRLIRTACAAFQKRGNQVAGMTPYFNAYLNELDPLIKIELEQFEGNRFNIIFHNAGGVYYHRDHMLYFIQDAAPTVNRLLLAVAEDVQNKVFLAGVRALGLIGKFITGPYFKIVGETERIPDLNDHLSKLQIALQQLSENASPLLEGLPVFDEEIVHLHKSCVFDSLLQTSDHEFDVLTQQATELICSAMLLVLENQCEDQLPGGKYWQPDENFKTQAASVPTSNIVSERDFAVFDVLLKTRPNATTVAVEALIMWANNKPSKWLENLSDSERAERFEEARANVIPIKERMKARRKQILDERKKKMQEKQQKKEGDEKKKSQQKMELLLKIEKIGGLWKSVEAVNRHLRNCDEKEKIDMLYVQLQFHNFVLNSSSPERYYFQKSRTLNQQKIDFTANDMIKHLKEIIKLNIGVIDPSLAPETLVAISESEREKASEPVYDIIPELERQAELQKQKESLYNFVKEARMKRKTKKSKASLEELLADPSLLVGKRVKHLVQEDKKSQPEWFDATVLRIDNPSEDTIRTRYEIIYDIDGVDKKFSFSLLSVLKRGELIIL